MGEFLKYCSRACHSRLGLSLVVCFLYACNGASPGGDGIAPLPPGSDASILYVTNSSSMAVHSYDNAHTLNGTEPDRTVTGVSTGITNPTGVAIDMARDEMYVADFIGNVIQVFANARSADGDVAPVRTITGGVTVDTKLDGPSRLYLDIAHDRLYVVNTIGKSVMVFDNASSVDVDDPPTRVLTGPLTRLVAPLGITVDITRDRLYVSSFDTNVPPNSHILIFANASTIDGDTAPVGDISGATTTLNNSAGLFVNVLTDLLYVANTGTNSFDSSLLLFANVSVADGDIAPAATVSGAGSQLDLPIDVYLNMATDELYVVNFAINGTVLVFNDAATISNLSSPDRVVTLPLTTIALGVFVDVTPFVLPSTASLDGEIATDLVTFITPTTIGGSPRTGEVETFPPTVPDTIHHQLFSFDLSSLPADMLIATADLRLYQANVSGPLTPYGLSASQLGNVIVDHVDYGPSLDANDFDVNNIATNNFDAISLMTNIGTLSSNDPIEYKTLTLTDSVQDDVDNARPASQYRTRFSAIQNDDGDEDFVQFTDAEDSCCGVNQPPQLVLTLFPI